MAAHLPRRPALRQILTPSLLALLLTACNSPETSMTQTHSPATEAAAEADVAAGGRGQVLMDTAIGNFREWLSRSRSVIGSRGSSAAGGCCRSRRCSG
ncbi:hypothetical protein EYR27_13770 [Xanthomonas oryzae]|nr:hypothetical protein EYR27_13770 [Xanthomonas oryzae]